MTNRLIHETSPYLRQHAHNPVDWYPWGPEALERARRAGSAHLSQHRLLRLPLVPCHGARKFRKPGRGQDAQRALRQHQGRSRGTARSRSDLHGGRADDDQARRLADVDVSDAGLEAILRRHLFPARRSLRPARFSSPPRQPCQGLARTAQRRRGAGGESHGTRTGRRCIWNRAKTRCSARICCTTPASR